MVGRVLPGVSRSSLAQVKPKPFSKVVGRNMEPEGEGGGGVQSLSYLFFIHCHY